MIQPDYERYPLLKDYDFVFHMDNKPGRGTLLIPNENTGSYRAKGYGFGELNLIPYIQDPFNKGESITLKKLVEELDDENELVLKDTKSLFDDQPPFLYKVINRLEKHKIIIIDSRFKDKLNYSNLDIISPGKNYETDRVKSLLKDRNEMIMPLMPAFP